MDIQILRDQTGRKIGEIETQRDGEQIIRDATGRKRGSYDPKRNFTYDENGRHVGEGNLLASLITSSQKINNPWGPLLGGIGGYLLGRMTSEKDTKQSECEEGYVQENEPDEDDESIPPVVELENEINEYFLQVLEPQKKSGLDKTVETLYGTPMPEMPEEGRILQYCDSTQEEIEDDNRLTDSDKNVLYELLSKRRKYFQELSQFKGNCIDQEKRKAEEDKFRNLFEKIFQNHQNTKLNKGEKKPNYSKLTIRPEEGLKYNYNLQEKMDCYYLLLTLSKERLKYNYNLTEAQKVELRKLADEYIGKMRKTDDAVVNGWSYLKEVDERREKIRNTDKAVTNANKEVLETYTDKKRDNATIATKNMSRTPERSTLGRSYGRSKYITMAIVLFVLLPFSALLLGPLFLLGAPVVILVVYLLVSAIFRLLSRQP